VAAEFLAGLADPGHRLRMVEKRDKPFFLCHLPAKLDHIQKLAFDNFRFHDAVIPSFKTRCLCRAYYENTI